MSPLLGIDYGQRRIGLAVSDEREVLATALGAHRTPDDGPFFQYLGNLIAARGITALVLGLPLAEGGEESRLATRVRAFAEKLRAQTGLPVILVDERYSSREAARTLREAGRRRARGLIDALAAEIILQQYLDSRRAAVVEDVGEAGEPPAPLSPGAPPEPGDAAP